MSTRCETVRAQLVDYNYGELEHTARREVAQHLGACAECALEYCRLDAELSGIGDLCDEAPRADVRAALRAQVRAEFSEHWWRKIWRLGAFPIPAYQTAILLVVVLLAWVFFGPRLGEEAIGPASSGARAPSRGAHATILTNYDASQIAPLDPSLL